MKYEPYTCPSCGNLVYYVSPPNLVYGIFEDGLIDLSSEREDPLGDVPHVRVFCENKRCDQKFLFMRLLDRLTIQPIKFIFMK